MPPPPGFLVSPKVGVAGLCFAFVAAAVAYVVIPFIVTDAPAPAAPADMGMPTMRMEHVDENELAAIIPEEIAPELEAELTAWFASPSRSAIADGAQREEPEWVEHLLDDAVRGRMDRLPLRVFGTLENVPAALADPGAYRGRLLRVWGRLDALDETELLLSSGTREAWRVQLSDASGVPWAVTLAAPPPRNVHVGDWVKVVGPFVKTWSLDGRPALHVFSTRSPTRSYPPVAHTSPQIEWLEDVRDESPDVSTTIEDEPFYGMLNYVRTLGPEGYRRLRDSGAIEVTDLTSTQGLTPLVKNPQAHRFAAVRMRLAPILKEFVVDRSLGENPGNIDMVYRGYLVDDQMRPVFWVSPFPRETFDFDGARIVEAEGFFLKRRRVEGGNSKPYWLPIIIGTEIRAVDVGEVDVGADIRVIAALVGVGSLAMLIVLLVVWRRTRDAEDAVRKRLTERRARHGRITPP